MTPLFLNFTYFSIGRTVNTEGKKTREWTTSGVGHLERMKHGSGISGRGDKSRGIEMIITEVFSRINPSEPLRLSKEVERRKRN
jgi:hypothetical protein